MVSRVCRTNGLGVARSRKQGGQNRTHGHNAWHHSVCSIADDDYGIVPSKASHRCDRFQTHQIKRVTTAQLQRAIITVRSEKVLKRFLLKMPMLPVLCCADMYSPSLPLHNTCPVLAHIRFSCPLDFPALTPLHPNTLPSFSAPTQVECKHFAAEKWCISTAPRPTVWLAHESRLDDLFLWGRCMHGYANCGVYYIYLHIHLNMYILYTICLCMKRRLLIL